MTSTTLTGQTVLPLIVHLRVPFQLALSVIVLWGVLCDSGRVDAGTLWGWLAFTVFLSGGATAFNSAYDRDEGPVGGLRRPPRVSPMLLPFSVAVQIAGLPLAWLAGGAPVLLVYVAAMLLFTAYSHPLVRFKAHPWLSTLTVAAASGVLCFLAGVLSAAEGPAPPSWVRLAGAISSACVIAGFYPLTQLGQLHEDRARGDRTFALVHGREGSFRWAFGMLAIAGALNVAITAASVGWSAAAGLACGLAVLGVWVLRWRRDPAQDSTAIADWLAYGSAAVHAVPVIVRVTMLS